MTDKQDVIVSLLKEIDKNIENLGGSETDVLLSNRITTLENSVKTINTDINGIKTTNTTQTTNITSNTNKINTTNTNVSNLTTRVTNVENKATTNESNINTLNERVTTLENAEPSGGGGGTTSGGYPIVTVEDDFNITAEPNTFYDIRNPKDTTINITTDKNIYSISLTSQSYYCFTGEGMAEDALLMFALCGISIISDSSIEGFKYAALVHSGFLLGQDTDILLSDLPTNGGTITVRINTEDGNQDMIISNIVLNDIGEYVIFALFDDPDMGLSVKVPIHSINEVENDRDDYEYKYSIGGILWMIQASYDDGNAYMYTNNPYVNAPVALIPVNGCSGASTYYELPITVEPVKTIIYNNLSSINEFVFNFNSPANINFNQVVNWNNENVPDLTQTGIYTVSILNGIGCYTFIKS